MRKLILAPFILCACLEPVPRPAEFPGVTDLISITECWYAYLCFAACEGDLDCAVECREAYSEVADQAAEALYQATRFGEKDAQVACFQGAFGVV